MFMFPEPPPIDHYITDVSSSYLSDGVFYHGTPAPCHRYVAKHLRPIKRTLNDPPPPVRQIEPRHLERLLEREKEGYVDPCGEDDGLVYETIRSMPRRKGGRPTAQRSLFSIFPRSTQYELCCIRERREKDAAKRRIVTVECPKEEKMIKKDESPCHLLRPPFWWRDHAGEPRRLPVGNINDYAFRKLAESEQDDRKISEKLEMDHPRKYIPGVIHRLTNPEDTSMKDVLDKADSFEVVLKSDETLPDSGSPKAGSPFAECTHSRKRPCTTVPPDSKRTQDARDADKAEFDSDRRWQPLFKGVGCSRTDPERLEELRKVTRPFLHDLHTWYSKNKPTKLMAPVRYTGKRPMPGRRISHL